MAYTYIDYLIKLINWLRQLKYEKFKNTYTPNTIFKLYYYRSKLNMYGTKNKIRGTNK